MRFRKLRLHKQIAERRMGRVGGGRCKHDFGVTRQLDRASRVGMVPDRDAAELHVVATFPLGDSDDIGHFLDRMNRVTGIERTVSDDALRLMMAYDWPGNVRELESCLERATTLTSGGTTYTTTMTYDQDGLPTGYGPFTIARTGPLGAPSRSPPPLPAWGRGSPVLALRRRRCHRDHRIARPVVE